MCYISAAGDAYCPLPIAPNRGAQNIFETGISRDINIMMEIREPAYTTAEIPADILRLSSSLLLPPTGSYLAAGTNLQFYFMITVPATGWKTFSLNSPVTASLF
jgi:hypothetical protein